MPHKTACAIALLAAVLAVSEGEAAPLVDYAVDFQDIIVYVPGVPGTISTCIGIPIPVPFIGGALWCIGIGDRITLTGNGSVPLVSLGYVPMPPEGATQFAVTTIYALEPNPGTLPLELTGFDPLVPQIVPVGNEEFIGRSGTVYQADPPLVVPVGYLATLFPDFDLTPFAASDPNSIVYVNRALLPMSDFLPEPGALGLWAVVGAIGVACAMRLRRGRHAAS